MINIRVNNQTVDVDAAPDTYPRIRRAIHRAAELQRAAAAAGGGAQSNVAAYASKGAHS